ncbi:MULTISPECIES: nucleotide sugar dehydrogenase [Halococcus]|uniref:UDP-N-acetyl-D-mannosamine dehydrogenase n=1 Tax=Halococcus salifodinae DSM 8989 TaxID=1227456 RepID=M0MXF1_9EURY|nr:MULTISPECIES: nucleotide sugar dehydrogenase [Halococcus]EMA50417.1 UDP-N-acetyl-D-mannosaminuronic acid dehydrogenase [Halococcus salifodinae DSM 8989]
MSRVAETTSLYGSDATAERQREAFRDGKVPVAVYGLGKMGLPLAAAYAEVCGNVVGADADSEVVAAVDAGECHVAREPGLDDLVADLVAQDALSATDNRTAAAAASVHVLIVPTRIDAENAPDLSILESVVGDVAAGLEPGDLVVVECTVPPKTCEEVVIPQLERESGLDFGEFGVAFCPERTSSGRALEDIRGAYPKVVGGVDDESTRTATILYEAINEKGVLAVSDATTAEAVKLFEGVYRDVNIALANELGRFTDDLGIDVTEAIATANTQPFCDIHDPGPGVGGHCIPYYPYFLLDGREADGPLLETARAVNDGMPDFVVEKLREEFAAEGSALADARVLVLGLTYRPGVEETAATPAGSIIDGLNEAGADVLCADPLLDDAGFAEFDATPVAVGNVTDRPLDGVVVVTPHTEFDGIDWTAFERRGEHDGLVVIDGRDSLDLAGTTHRTYTIGRGRDV